MFINSLPTSARRPALITVSGSATPNDIEWDAAKELGTICAEQSLVVLCGGGGGVMEAVARGCKEADGVCIGFLPGDDPLEGNPYLTHVIPTGLGQLRSTLLATASIGTIAIGGGAGTLSELATSKHYGKPVAAHMSWEIRRPSVEQKENGIYWAVSPKDALDKVLEVAELTLFVPSKLPRNVLRPYLEAAKRLPQDAQLISVCGTTSTPTVEDVTNATQIGRSCAENNLIVLCDGVGPIAEALAKSAYQNGGITIGLVPGASPNAASRYFTYAIPTGDLSSTLVAWAGAATIAIGTDWGTLSQAATAKRAGKPVFSVGGWDLIEPGTDAIYPEIHTPVNGNDAVKQACATLGIAWRSFDTDAPPFNNDNFFN